MKYNLTRSVVPLNTYVDVLNWSMKHQLPSSMEQMDPLEAYVVPLNYLDYEDTQGIVFTAKRQVGWIKQLVDGSVTVYYQLHIDGKHKLHCGKWMLLTLGTHSLEYDLTRKVRLSPHY